LFVVSNAAQNKVLDPKPLSIIVGEPKEIDVPLTVPTIPSGVAFVLS